MLGLVCLTAPPLNTPTYLIENVFLIVTGNQPTKLPTTVLLIGYPV